MPSFEETYIVRVRHAEGDAVVEDARSRRRLHVEDLSEIGSVIASLAALGHRRGAPPAADEARRRCTHSQ